MSQGSSYGIPISTDGTLADNSDFLVPSQKAVKTYSDTKSPIASPTFTGTVTTPAIIVSSETASRVAIIDASKNVKSADTATYPSLTELSYVKGVTSAIQTQFGAKADMPYNIQADTSTGFTLANGDFPATKILWYTCSNAGAITITIPSDATLTTVDIGDTIVFEQIGAGQITIAASGTTLRNADSAYTSRAQYSKIWATKVAASTWSIGGDTL